MSSLKRIDAFGDVCWGFGIWSIYNQSPLVHLSIQEPLQQHIYPFFAYPPPALSKKVRKNTFLQSRYITIAFALKSGPVRL